MSEPDVIEIKINFTVEAPSEDDPLASSYPYRDALIMPLRHYELFDKKDIEMLKEKRHQAWRESVLEAINRPMPTPEELQRQVNEAKLLADRELLVQGLAAQDALIAAFQTDQEQ